MSVGHTYTTREAAKYLGVTEETIRRNYRRKYLIGARDLGAEGRPLRFLREDLDRFRASRVVTPK